jgi:hypothetical protein
MRLPERSMKTSLRFHVHSQELRLNSGSADGSADVVGPLVL